MIVRYVEMVYLDNGATTKVDEEVIKEMNEALSSKYGNPSSIHEKGHEALKLVEDARTVLANEINCNRDEIIFTSSGTESTNLALNFLEKGDHLITSIIEHPCIYEKAKELEKIGVDVTYLDVDKEGFIDLAKLKLSIKDNTKLVSVIHGNNEMGTIQDLEKIGLICKENDVLFHSDCVQTLKKTKIDIKKMNLSLASFSAHKIHGPKGIGALYVKQGIKLKPIIFGGGQEKNIRSGTENVPGIAGFKKALELEYPNQKIKELRDYFISQIEEKIDNIKLNGHKENRLCNNANISFLRIEGEGILMSLDMEGIYVSTGSACSSRYLKASRVLLAMGNNHETAHGSIRFTFSKYNTKEEIDFAIEKTVEVVKRLRGISAL
ncbi:cysteine desulfurase [Candidatus Woesearchaeota archaeon]|nr:cysteine desulfurase [Candidatus Woesearchaeota archaeon]